MKETTVICYGDSMTDQWETIRRKETGEHIESFAVSDRTATPGGAANVLRQLTRHPNVNLHLVSLLDGRLNECLSGQHVRRDQLQPINRYFSIREPNARCSVKTRLWDGERMLTRLDEDYENYGLAPSLMDEIRSALYQRFAHAVNTRPDLVIISDYGKGLLNNDIVQKAVRLCSERGVRVIVDPKTVQASAVYHAVVKCNSAWADRHRDEMQFIKDYVITHGAEPPKGFLSGERFEFPAYTVEQRKYQQPVFTVGAGDCFAAYLGMALAGGKYGVEAVKVAQAAATRYVRMGFTEPMFRFEAEGNKLVTARDVSRWCRARVNNPVIVAACGCFDLLHPGHLHTLKWARSQGTCLVVFVNDDASVRRLKGDGRPAISQADRMAMLAGLECVDFVVPFTGDSPAEVMELAGASCLVKGPEWAGRDKDVPEAAHGFPVKVAPSCAFTQHTSDLIGVTGQGIKRG